MTAYFYNYTHPLIAEAIGTSDQSILMEVEQEMRSVHGTLDHLTKKEIMKFAKQTKSLAIR